MKRKAKFRVGQTVMIYRNEVRPIAREQGKRWRQP